MNPKNGSIIWERFFPDILNAFFMEKSQTLIVVYNENKIIKVNPKSGNYTATDKELPFNLLSAVRISSRKEGIILFGEPEKENNSMNIMIYCPDHSKECVNNKMLQDSTFCRVLNDSVSGYKIRSPEKKAKIIWNIYYNNATEVILGHSLNQLEKNEFQFIEESNGNIIYKYVSSNILALLTRSSIYNKKMINLTLSLINTANGNFVKRVGITNVGIQFLPQLVMHENMIFVSYQKIYANNKIENKILCMEMYFPRIEKEASSILGNYFFNPEANEIGKNDSHYLPLPKFINRTYILPFAVKALEVTRFKKGITNSHILLVNANNEVFSISKSILDPRRPSLSDITDYDNFDFLPYKPFVPLEYFNSLSKNASLLQIRTLKTLPCSHETTTLVIASGLDLFVSVFSPEGEYANFKISPIFQNLILISIFLLLLFVIILRKYSKWRVAKFAYLLQQ